MHQNGQNWLRMDTKMQPFSLSWINYFCWEREENLNSHSYDSLLTIEKYIYIYTSLGELTTIHVTYIKKGKTVHYIYIIFNRVIFSHSIFFGCNPSAIKKRTTFLFDQILLVITPSLSTSSTPSFMFNVGGNWIMASSWKEWS